MNSTLNQGIDFKVLEMVWLELDYAVGAFAFGRNRRYLTDEQIKVYQRIPKDWYQLATLVLPKTDEQFMLFEMLSMLCPRDYMTRSYGEISYYLQNIEDEVWQIWLDKAGVESISEYMMLVARKQQEGIEESYIHLPRMQEAMSKTAEHIEKLYTSPTLAPGFWKCIDVFVEHYYFDWRKEQEDKIAEKKAYFEALRTKPGGCTMGDLLDVLPKTNALYYRSALRKHVLDGTLPLVIWIEPIGLFDSWAILRGSLVISVSQPEQLFQIAKDEILEIAEKGKALGDPTRLGLLRVIRHFDMDITEMADYFGLARPTVSIHIKKLREAGLVDSYEEGRSTRHVLNAKNLKALLDEIMGFFELE